MKPRWLICPMKYVFTCRTTNATDWIVKDDKMFSSFLARWQDGSSLKKYQHVNREPTEKSSLHCPVKKLAVFSSRQPRSTTSACIFRATFWQTVSLNQAIFGKQEAQTDECISAETLNMCLLPCLESCVATAWRSESSKHTLSTLKFLTLSQLSCKAMYALWLFTARKPVCKLTLPPQHTPSNTCLWDATPQLGWTRVLHTNIQTKRFFTKDLLKDSWRTFVHVWQELRPYKTADAQK